MFIHFGPIIVSHISPTSGARTMQRTSLVFRFFFFSILICGIAVGITSNRTAGAQSAIKITMTQNTLDIFDGDKPVLTYKYLDVPFKPYIQCLYTPDGFNILRDAPHDHLHHHALMFALRVDGTTFWEETEKGGKETHQAFTDIRITPEDNNGTAGFTESLIWSSPDQKKLLDETRTVNVLRSGKSGPTLLEWQTTLSLHQGVSSVTISGNHYYGLGMRFLQSMDKIGTFLNSQKSDGEVFNGTEKLTEAEWCAYSVDANGMPVTVAMFDTPDNPKPVTWFTMTDPFSFLSATLRYHEAPFDLNAGQTLTLRYAVAVWDGLIKPEEIEQQYHSWTSSK